MTQSDNLRLILADLRLSDYLDVFVAEGFDDWSTICEITEADLEYLGVQIGHRRRLQRAIAESIGSPAQANAGTSSLRNYQPGSLLQTEVGTREASGTTSAAVTPEGQGRAKRKYKRHPKPDINAPIKPASAYVLFSHHVRENLKGEAIDFTAMAKTVGAQWQSLPAAEREMYNQTANENKEQYNSELAEYRKTDNFHNYRQYLTEFKARLESKGAKRLRGESNDAEEGDSSPKKSRSRSLDDKPSVKPLALQDPAPSAERLINSPSGRMYLPPVYGGDYSSPQSARSNDWSNQPANTVPAGLQRSVLDPYRQFSGLSTSVTNTSRPAPSQWQGYMSLQRGLSDDSIAPPDRSSDSPQQMPSSYNYLHAYRPSIPQQVTTTRVSNRLPPLLSQDSAGTYDSRQPLSYFNEANSNHHQTRDMSRRRSRAQDELRGRSLAQHPSTSSSSRSGEQNNMHTGDPVSPHTGRMVDGNLTPPPRPAAAAENPNQQFPLEQAASLASKKWGGRHDVDALLDPEGMNSYPAPNVSEVRSKRNLRDSNKSGSLDR